MSRPRAPLAAAAPAAPLATAEFATLVAPLGPFEAAPRVAVAVSGGADSMALALLAHRWARQRRGQAVALTVDHGLRPGSAREAAQAGRRLAARGMAHRVLRWSGEKPAADVQAAARDARYALLEDWCRRAGIVHLFLAHHRDDQAETLLLRLGRGSGAWGLAAMAPVVETAAVRLLRPLLPVGRDRLRATLHAAGQPWAEDPSNESPAFARVRVRRALPALAEAGIATARIAETAARLGRARAALEDAVARLLAVAVEIHPAGWCRLDPVPFAAAPPEVSLRAVAAVLRTVAGAPYVVRAERLARLHDALAGGSLTAPRTLGGCVIGPWRGGLVVAREPAAATGALRLSPGASMVWDGRFGVRAGAGWRDRPSARLAALESRGWTALRRTAAHVRDLPAAVRPALPAVWQDDCLMAVPHLAAADGLPPLDVRFAPPVALAGALFSVV
ncbi:MAG: tRNA lysidine(34) synthetase TilS [Rhodospirillales bacterium]